MSWTYVELSDLRFVLRNVPAENGRVPRPPRPPSRLGTRPYTPPVRSSEQPMEARPVPPVQQTALDLSTGGSGRPPDEDLREVQEGTSRLTIEPGPSSLATTPTFRRSHFEWDFLKILAIFIVHSSNATFCANPYRIPMSLKTESKRVIHARILSSETSKINIFVLTTKT
jgi:hypothetical protein